MFNNILVNTSTQFPSFVAKSSWTNKWVPKCVNCELHCLFEKRRYSKLNYLCSEQWMPIHYRNTSFWPCKLTRWSAVNEQDKIYCCEEAVLIYVRGEEMMATHIPVLLTYLGRKQQTANTGRSRGFGESTRSFSYLAQINLHPWLYFYWCGEGLDKDHGFTRCSYFRSNLLKFLFLKMYASLLE